MPRTDDVPAPAIGIVAEIVASRHGRIRTDESIDRFNVKLNLSLRLHSYTLRCFARGEKTKLKTASPTFFASTSI